MLVYIYLFQLLDVYNVRLASPYTCLRCTQLHCTALFDLHTQIRFVPVSGLTGANVAERNPDAAATVTSTSTATSLALAEWYTGPTLVDCIDSFTPTPKLALKPFRFACQFYFSGGDGIAARGRILQGRLKVGDHVMLMPGREIGTVKRISRLVPTRAEQWNRETEEMKHSITASSDILDVEVAGVDKEALGGGDICMCKAKTPVRVVHKLEAQLSTLAALQIPLIR